jgi:hypothetical protein
MGVGHALDAESRDLRHSRVVPGVEADERSEPSPELDSDEAIVCAACRHPVTSERQRISVNGGHEHHCVNPHGLLFHIGCFAAAPGCDTSGETTVDFTWFPGFAWTHALCGACRQHLGWHFVGAGNAAFFGLVLNRLVIDETPRQ